MRRRGSALCSALLWLAWAGCRSEGSLPPTQALVQIDSDLAVGRELGRLALELRDAAGQLLDEQSYARAELALPLSYRIERPGVQRLLLRARGYAPERAEVAVEHAAWLTLREHLSLRFELFLAARCAERDCAEDETCHPAAEGDQEAGRCGPLPELAAISGHGLDAGAGDASDAAEVCPVACAEEACGAPGCEGECGSCPEGERCSDGACVCAPDCAGKQCGPDGCGGECGPGCVADSGAVCSEGVCKLVCEAVVTSCNCQSVPDGARPGSDRSEPRCATGYCVFELCPDPGDGSTLCFDPLTNAVVGYQWGEICGC
jgi:hypothetical protein